MIEKLAWRDMQAKIIVDSSGALTETVCNEDLFLIQLYALKKQVDTAIIMLERSPHES